MVLLIQLCFWNSGVETQTGTEDVDMKRLFLLAVVVLIVLWSVGAVSGETASIDNVYVEPNQPTDSDSITLVASGTGSSHPAWITDSNFRMEGASLELDIFIKLGPFTMVSEWSHSEIIGTLPGNFYDLTTRAYTYNDLTGAYVLTHTYSISFTVIPAPVVEAAIEIRPKTLNLQSKGKWLTCHIWLPEDYNVADIEPNSVCLQSEPNDIYAEWIWFEEENEEFAMAKFRRSELEEILVPGEVELTVTGELADGTMFEGTDVIRVVHTGGKKK